MVVPSIYGQIQSDEATMPSTIEIACVLLNKVRPENKRRREGGKGEDCWLDEVFNVIFIPCRFRPLISSGVLVELFFKVLALFFLFLLFGEFRNPIAWSAPHIVHNSYWRRIKVIQRIKLGKADVADGTIAKLDPWRNNGNFFIQVCKYDMIIPWLH